MRLERLRPDKMMEVEANQAESLNKSLTIQSTSKTSIYYITWEYTNYPVTKIINGTEIQTSNSIICTNTGLTPLKVRGAIIVKIVESVCYYIR